MTAFGPRALVHPLDVELADLVDGILDPSRTLALESHLAGCLLCRVKRRRLQDAPPAVLDLDRPFPAPAFVVPTDDDAVAQPAPNELWLVRAEDEHLLVLVLRNDGQRVLAAPVTYDIGAADDETLVVGDLAIYPRLATALPTSLLVRRMGSVSTTGATSGGPITSPTDPRLEVRQYLADRLGELMEQSSLVADLRDLRGETCQVRPMTGWGDVDLAAAADWTPLMTVDEVGIVLVVIDTPHGLADDADFHVARSVLTRFNATALVVLASALSELADVFDSPSLNYGIDTPSGQRTPPRPLISGLAPFDAVGKFLDQTSGARIASATTRGPVERVDVGAILRQAAAAALTDAARQSARFKITPKRRGYESVGGPATEDRFQALLKQAFDADGAAVAQGLVDLSQEREP